MNGLQQTAKFSNVSIKTTKPIDAFW